MPRLQWSLISRKSQGNNIPKWETSKKKKERKIDIESEDRRRLGPIWNEKPKHLHFEIAVCKNFVRCVIAVLQLAKQSCNHSYIATNCHHLLCLRPEARWIRLMINITKPCIFTNAYTKTRHESTANRATITKKHDTTFIKACLTPDCRLPISQPMVAR